MNKERTIGIGVVFGCILLVLIVAFSFVTLGSLVVKTISYENGSLHILSSNDNKDLEKGIVEYANKEGFKVTFDYLGDLEMIDVLNNKSDEYDAVWISNSVWLYMLKDSKLTSEAKSISVSPVVLGIKKSKAKELNLMREDITNNDILNLIKEKKIKYVMSSVTQTNDGASSYLGFLNALAGSPNVLTSEMLDDETLIENMKNLFKGVERVSGDQNFLEEMFLNSDVYEAVIASESSLININKELKNRNKEELYLLYPQDGVPINDSKLAFINHYENDTKKENYLKLQKYLRSKEGQDSIKALGRRTWYGGISTEDKTIFNSEWGIDTSKYLTGSKFPGEDVITKALNIYIEEIRKPSHTVFCLDYSGSMYGSGINSLRDAMDYILTYEKASEDKLQFSKHDVISVLRFSTTVETPMVTKNGRETETILNGIKYKDPYGGTAIYSCASEAVKILQNESDDYIKTVILMTDGENTVGNYRNFFDYYIKTDKTIPVYSIMFGSAQRSELEDIAKLTNARVFDGRTNLLEAFKEVRGYN